MKRFFGIVLLVGSGAVACSGSDGSATFDGSSPGSSHLRLDIACSSSADCPASFECQTETEHGTTTSFCSSVEVISPTGDGGAMCPAGYEVEQEHGISFCKPHGGGHDEHEGGAAGNDDGADHEANDDHDDGGAGNRGPGHAGDDRGAGGAGNEGHGHSGK